MHFPNELMRYIMEIKYRNYLYETKGFCLECKIPSTKCKKCFCHKCNGNSCYTIGGFHCIACFGKYCLKQDHVKFSNDKWMCIECYYTAVLVKSKFS